MIKIFLMTILLVLSQTLAAQVTQPPSQFNRADVTIINQSKACYFKCDKEVQEISLYNGLSQCLPATTVSCFPYRCDTAKGICRTTCQTSNDCGAGNVCHDVTGTCRVQSYTCKDAFTVISANGNESSCMGYRCLAGQCRSTCLTSAECATGFTCNASGRCVK